MPLAQAYHARRDVLTLGDDFYDVVAPAQFPRATLRFRNQRWAEAVGLGALDPAEWAAHFARFEPLPGGLEAPLALRYHGHQFRHYNPDLGDGRGFLFAQLDGPDGKLLDLGTKGSGQTPWSRQGDGRLTLKGGVREVLASEMLEALGVTTSKSFALIETGEQLVRGDEPSPTRSAVLTRLSHGHVRIGTFQRLAFHDDTAGLARLTDYVLRRLYGAVPTGSAANDAVTLFDLVAGATARLAAGYVAAGFVHGVLNSDNIAITGESFDYGPWRFTPEWDEQFTAAYFDHHGLYAFGRQPEAIQWDLAQLGGCLSLLTGETGPLEAVLEGWSAPFEAALAEAMVRRLGVAPDGPAADRALLSAMLAALRTRKVGIDRFFFDWRGGRVPAGADLSDPAFAALAGQVAGRARPPGHPYWAGDAPCSMLIDEVEAIWARIDADDDWGPFEAKIASIRDMGEAMTSDGIA